MWECLNLERKDENLEIFVMNEIFCSEFCMCYFIFYVYKNLCNVEKIEFLERNNLFEVFISGFWRKGLNTEMLVYKNNRCKIFVFI